MISKEQIPVGPGDEEIPALIETLLAAEQRLDDLTAGQIDSVAGRDGRTFLLRRAQDQLRHNEAVKQAAILNALPAHIALLDAQGAILSVNEAWRRFADTNTLVAPGHGVGLNYLDICDRARGNYSSEAHQVAEGVRAVLDHGKEIFSIEYPCHSRTEQRWFMLTVTPLAHDYSKGAVVMHLNITERKRTEEALRVSEERLRAALSASRTGTFRWEFANNELSWDDSLDALFGIPQGQAVRSLETFIARVHPDDRPDVIERCQRCANEGADFDAEFRVVWPDASLHWLDDKGKTFFDAAGRPQYMTGACVDITERKLAETALRASEAEFRALAEAMPQMVWITRSDGWNIYFSQQWMDYTGLTLEESLGHGWSKPFHPEDQQRAWDAWQQAMATNGVYSIESRLRRADGAYRWWLIRAVPQMNAGGNILKWFGTCTDIHEMKLAELEISRANQALLASDEKFRHLADNISDVFWIASPDLTTIHYVSAGYEVTWGRSSESLYANPHEWVEALFPEERDSVIATFDALISTTPKVSVEYRIVRPDGTVRWIHTRGFQVRDAEGQLVRLTGITSDITERKNLEAQLRQGQKMEAIGTLAGGIAHDFNNILAAIMGYSELALKGITAGSRSHRHVEQVMTASIRARNLVQQILTFSRHEEHELKFLQLQPIINETLKLLRITLPATITIRREIDSAAPGILGDARQIQQLIMNLFVNAGHAMKGVDGVLTISLTCPDLDSGFRRDHPELKAGTHVCLKVTDSGCGMDPATQARIFDPFFTTREPGEGTGLGLAMVHGIVKNHDGAISVQSEPGEGTTFSLYLPASYGAEVAVASQIVTVPKGNGEHILHVDDEKAWPG